MNTMPRNFVSALYLALVLLLLNTSGRAQTTFGSITGTVTDPSGGSVPSARVTVTNQATGSQQHIATNQGGVFNAPDIQPGTYDVQVAAPGFRLLQRSGIVVYAHNTVNVNISLSMGEAKTAVEVSGAPPVIDTVSQTLSYTQTAAQLSQAATTTGLQDTNQYFALYTPSVGINSGGGEIHAYGVRTADTRVANDGIIEMADADGVGGGPIGPAPGSISEVTTVTNGATAEYQEPTNVVVVTKSGSNTFHGTAVWDWNGSDLNARNFFSSTVPFNNFNDFSGNVGGPIKKNKLFFFANYEALRSRGQSVLTANVPLPGWRNGNFSDLSKSIVNPFTGQPFPGNQIPASLISSVSQKAQSFFFPTPNFGPAGLQSGNWRDLLPSTSSSDTGDGRIDYKISDRDSVFGRFTYHANTSIGVNGGSLPAAVYDVTRPTTSAFLSWTHIFSPNLLNEFRTGVSRNNEVEGPALIGSDVLNQIGLQGVNAPTGLPGQPIINITGISNTNAHSGPVHNLDTNFQVVNNVSWTKGQHFLKFGVDIIRDQLSSFFNGNNIYGDLSFNGVYSGSPYADFLLGIPQTTSVNAFPPFPYLRGTVWGFYAQDQFKITKRLTLNYGIRYELDSPYYDKNGAIYSFDPSTLSIVVPQNGLRLVSAFFPKTIPIVTAQQAGYPANSLMDYRKSNFYPRVGVAYQLTADGKTALRAGYGMYSDTIYPSIVQKGGPFAGSESFFNSITGGVPALSFPNPFSAAGTAGSFQNVSAANPNISVPYTQQWNITLERQIGEFAISVSYIGTHGTDLLYERNLNEPAPSTIPFTKSRYLLSPAFSSINWFNNGGNEQYNGLQVAVTKTVGQNLTLNSSWTWARDLSTVTDTATVIQNQFDLAAERGNNPFTPNQHFYAMVVYALPIGSGQRFLKTLPPVANQILGGWRISAIETDQTGLWFTPSFSGFDTSNTNTIGGRPNELAGVPLYPANRGLGEWFNPAAFAVPGCPPATPVCSKPADVGAFGNAATYQLQGPRLDNLDLGLVKDFRILEGKTLQFEAIFSDALNHPHFGFPAANISSPATVGQITSTIGGNYLRGSADERQINFALRFEF
jgi:hypothetical protein